MAKINNIRRREFFLTFFTEKEENQVLELNGFVLFKHWNGDGKFWTVDLFTPESWKAMKARTYQAPLL